jgi:hypothetical protein
MSDAEHPQPPSLEALVVKHDGYDNITPEAWARFEADMARWKDMVRDGGNPRPVSKSADKSASAGVRR